MGRLIDADDVKKMLFDTFEKEKDVISSFWVAGTLADKVDELQTAYDANKVVEQLQEWTFNANIDIGDGTIMNHNLIVRDVAVDIVKAGGIDDAI